MSLAFTTTASAAGVSLIGTSGVDDTSFAPSDLVASHFIGAQAAADTVELTAAGENITAYLGEGADTFAADDLTDATVLGNNGVDTITAADIDTAWLNGNAGDDTIQVAAATDSTLHGGQGDDTIETTGDITDSLINGNKDDDEITLGAAAFDGGTVRGGQGDDTIDASNATDGTLLFGDDGNDDITGSTTDADTMTGGAGVDEFTALATAGQTAYGVAVTQVDNIDAITDFAAGRGGDIVDINDFTFDATWTNDDAAAVWNGTGASFFALGRYVGGVFTIGAGNDMLLSSGDAVTEGEAVVFVGVNDIEDLVTQNFA